MDQWMSLAWQNTKLENKAFLGFLWRKSDFWIWPKKIAKIILTPLVIFLIKNIAQNLRKFSCTRVDPKNSISCTIELKKQNNQFKVQTGQKKSFTSEISGFVLLAFNPLYIHQQQRMLFRRENPSSQRQSESLFQKSKIP